jgi:hypothetical protein
MSMKKYRIEVRKRSAPSLTQFKFVAEAYSMTGNFVQLAGGDTPAEAKRRIENILNGANELVETYTVTLNADDE